MPFINPELSLIKQVQNNAHSMQKYFRQLTADPSIRLKLDADQNSFVISSQEFFEDALLKLTNEINPFLTKINKKTNQTEPVGKTESTKNQIIIKFKNKVKWLEFSKKINNKYETSRNSQAIIDSGMICAIKIDTESEVKFINLMENILIQIKNDRIKHYIKEQYLDYSKKPPQEIAKIGDQLKSLHTQASQQFAETGKITDELANQSKQLYQQLYADSQTESYDHHEQSKNMHKVFYFHQNLCKSDPLYEKAHALHEKICEVHKQAFEVLQIQAKNLGAHHNSATPDDYTFGFRETAKTNQFINNLKINSDQSIQYCQIITNIIEEINLSINDENICEIYQDIIKHLNKLKTDLNLSTLERFNKLKMLLNNLIISLKDENIANKLRSNSTQKSKGLFLPEITGSFNGFSLFGFKKTQSQPMKQSVPESNTAVAETLMLELLKKITQHIEEIIKTENNQLIKNIDNEQKLENHLEL